MSARATLWSALAVTLILGVFAAGAMNAMVLNRWEAPGSESVRAQQILERDFDTGNANLILLVTAPTGTVDDPAVTAEATALASELATDSMVGDVWSYWSLERDPTMRSADGRQAVILAWVRGDATEARAHIRETLLPAFTRDNVQVAGSEAVSAQISQQATADFVRAEIIIVPLMVALLILLYRRVRLALLTLGVGLFAVIGTLAGLRLLAGFTEVSTFAANITLVMGIGLGVDYSLFLISRFREELTAGAAVPQAVRTTVRTAGRTVVFSGLTVAASLSVLLVFPYPFLRSFAYAGVLVVVMAAVGTLVILPAALSVLGPRALRRRPPRTVDGQGFWYRTGSLVMRRPILSAVAGLIVVGVLAAPSFGLRIGLPDDRVLPPTASTRQAYDELRAGFAVEAHDAVQVIVPVAGDVSAYAEALSRVPGVAQVNSATDRLVSGGSQRIEVIPTGDGLDDAQALMERLRAVPAPHPDVLFGGYPAQLTDFRAALMDRVPLVAVLILAITFVLLFAMSRSLLIPVKATVLNLLSMAAMFGVLVFIFQNGAFAGLLGFTPIGTLDPAFPILMFCVAYGLSMDYEVFMLSRIKERYDETGDNRRAVLDGLQRSAPLITAAAAILAVSFAVYATGRVTYLQMIGVGVAVAILVDATIIRAVLVPAFMRLAGRANWWPALTPRKHDRPAPDTVAAEHWSDDSAPSRR